jgi:hypothetical protein
LAILSEVPTHCEEEGLEEIQSTSGNMMRLLAPMPELLPAFALVLLLFLVWVRFPKVIRHLQNLRRCGQYILLGEGRGIMLAGSNCLSRTANCTDELNVHIGHTSELPWSIPRIDWRKVLVKYSLEAP